MSAMIRGMAMFSRTVHKLRKLLGGVWRKVGVAGWICESLGEVAYQVKLGLIYDFVYRVPLGCHVPSFADWPTSPFSSLNISSYDNKNLVSSCH